MVQREVAKNMVAAPPQMNLLAVGIQIYGRPKLVRKVPPAAFYPRPRVDSTIVRIDVYDRPAVDVDNVNTFFRVVKAGFSTKRKQLHNSLSLGLGVPVTRTMKLLEEAGIGHKRRAQTMTLDEWASVARIFGDRYDNS
jgi:16S rRNA (adenine1518-N6/adenine1519-N6)-dimethyltransferase